MIEFIDVSMRYDTGYVALENVNLKIEDGEFVFIVGHSGAGKTTLTKLLMCEERITGGSLIIDGYSLRTIKDSEVSMLRRRLGIVFQDFRLFENKTVYENIAFPMRVTGTSPRVIKKRVNAFLNLVELADKKDSFPYELSGGQQQRVAFARAIANIPNIVIADEPTGNVDRRLSLQLFQLLEDINKQGKTVIVVTHDMELVRQYNKRVITIEGGHIAGDTKGGMTL